MSLTHSELARWEGLLHGLRVNELQSILGHFKSNKLGKKQELVTRAVSILRTPNYQQELIRVLNGMHQRTPRATPYNVPINNVQRYQQNGYLGSSGGAMYGGGGATMNMYPPQSQPVHNLNAAILPFYDHVRTILQPMKLTAVDSGAKLTRKEMFNFTIPVDLQHDLTYREGQKPLPRREIQLRFFQLPPTYYREELMDDFPFQCNVRIDDLSVPLPNVIPTNKPNVEAKRPSRPVDITPYCQPLRDHNRPHRMHIDWTGDKRAWAVGIYVVNRVTSEILRDRALSNNHYKMPLDVTKNLIIRRLTTDDDGIKMDQIRISLLCPLGRTRILIPARSRDCTHLQCFDLDLFLKMNEKRPTWKCAVCSGPAPYQKLLIDGYFQQMLQDVPQGTNEVELLKNGSYSLIKEEVNDISDSEDDSPRPAGHRNGAGDRTNSAGTSHVEDDIIVLDSDDDDEQLQRGITESVKTAQKGNATPKRDNDIPLICLDDDTPPRPPRAPEPPAQRANPLPGIVASSSSSTATAIPSTSSAHHQNQMSNGMGVQQQHAQMYMNQPSFSQYTGTWANVPGMNEHAGYPPQQQGGFIGSNMPMYAYHPYNPMPPTSAPMAQTTYRPPPNPQNLNNRNNNGNVHENLAHLLHSINPSFAAGGLQRQ